MSSWVIPITILCIIHRPVFYLKHDVSETGSCLYLQVEPINLDPIDINPIGVVAGVGRQRLALNIGPN
jgi:hypothetical protein